MLPEDFIDPFSFFTDVCIILHQGTFHLPLTLDWIVETALLLLCGALGMAVVCCGQELLCPAGAVEAYLETCALCDNRWA